ncbi:MAG TPA: amidase [Candidatus Binatia bacterium]|nr:amidase [Candidatus Binatia bacterium]
MLDLAFAPAHVLAAAVRCGELSPVDLMQATLDRLAALNPVLNAFVALREDDALAEARALAERIARGEDPGPLAGLPFGVKDEEDLAGLPTTRGSRVFKDHVPARDSTQVARLRAAGAVPIGKTNMPEFGYTAFTTNRLFGTTRNPWDLTRTPGGSSGGSAAAVAAGIVPLATGFDGGGSVRIPASYTGLFGLKPTYGRISRGPFQFFDWIDTISPGPMTRAVADAALFLDAVVGYDPHDRDSLPHPGYSYLARLDDVPRGLRLGYSPTLGYARVDADVRRTVEDAVETLARALDRPVDVVPGALTDVGLAWAMINCFERHAWVASLIEPHRDDWEPDFLHGLELGGKVGAVEMGFAMNLRRQLIDEVNALFARYDVLLTPTLPTVAFAAAGPLPRGADGGDFDSPIHAVAFTYPFNMTGHPAATVRAGFGGGGLPVGLQLVAERGREDLLLQVARAFERVRPMDEWPRVPRGRAA